MPRQTRRDAQYLSMLPAVRRQRTSHKYGSHHVSVLALKAVTSPRHISDPDLGGGARVAEATREEGSNNTTMTQEVSP